MPLKYAPAVRVGLQLHTRNGWEGEFCVSGVIAARGSELRGRRVGRLGQGRRGREEEREETAGSLGSVSACCSRQEKQGLSHAGI